MIFNLNGTPFKFHLLVVLHVFRVLRFLPVICVLSVVTRLLLEPILDRTHPAPFVRTKAKYTKY